MAKHLVTGAAGFLGSQIVEKLYAMGERDIVAFDVLACNALPEGVASVQGSVLDKDLVMSITEGVDYVHHNAALVPVTKAGSNFHEVNTLGTRTVVECCKKNAVKKLIYMSSSAIYGVPTDMPITEKTGYAPVEIYGVSKLEGEKEVWRYMEQGGNASCIRPRTIVGGKSRLGIFQILFEWISEGKNIYVIGDGRNLLQFVHVDDLIDASIKAAFSDAKGLYNIGAAHYGTLRDDLEALCRHAGTGTRVKSLPVSLAKFGLYCLDKLNLSPLAPWHYLSYHKPFVFDISKAQDELGWQPRYGNRESFIESYEWYLENRKLLKDGQSAHKKAVPQKVLKIIKFFS